MGLETDDEREARLKKGGAWLKAELKKRGWSQDYLARQLGVSQQTVSLYARGRVEISGALARDLAGILELPPREVWRGMGKREPDGDQVDDQDDEAIFRSMLDKKGPDFFLRILGEDYQLPDPDPDSPGPGAKQRRSPIKKPKVTRKDDPGDEESQGRASGA